MHSEVRGVVDKIVDWSGFGGLGLWHGRLIYSLRNARRGRRSEERPLEGSKLVMDGAIE